MGQYNAPNLTSVRGYAHEFSSHAAAKEWLSPFFNIVEVVTMPQYNTFELEQQQDGL